MRDGFREWCKEAASTGYKLAQAQRIASARERRRGRMRAAVLMYHHVRESGPSAVEPSQFRDHLEFLAEHAHVVTLETLIDRQDRRDVSADKPLVALTFDDGYADFSRVAWPLLRQYRLPATLFAISGCVDRELTPQAAREAGLTGSTFVTTDELRAMAREGLEVGAHTHTHPRLSSLDRDAQRDEIVRSKDAIETMIGSRVRYFAYPFGQFAHFDVATQELVREAGFEAACSTVWSTWHAPEDRFLIHRVRVDHTDGVRRLKLKVDGAYDWIHAVHRRGRSVRCT